MEPKVWICKRRLWLLPLLMLALFVVSPGEKASYAAGVIPLGTAEEIVVQDDFSTDIRDTNSVWNVLGDQVSVVSDTYGRYVELTSNAEGQVGTIWLRRDIAPPYTASFQIRIKPSAFSGAVADGMVFMFNKKQNLYPDSGGGMGFEVGNGYGIEFDTYLNYEDRVLYDAPDGERYVHTSLFKNSPLHLYEPQLGYKQLNTASSVTIDDGQWHSVRVEVGLNSVRMYLDNETEPYLNYSGVVDPTYHGLGFSASTGLYFSEHQIKDVKITKPYLLFNAAVMSPLTNIPTSSNVNVAASVYGVDPSAVQLKWLPGRVEDPVQLQNGGTSFTDSFQVSENGIYTIFAQYYYSGEIVQNGVQYVEVTNIDRVKPAIAYGGPTNITLTKGGSYTAPSFTLSDNFDTADQLELLSAGSVDMANVGTYSVSYQAKDRAGNVSDPINLFIHVIEPIPSVAVASFDTNRNVIEVLFNRELKLESIDFSKILVVSGGAGVTVTYDAGVTQSGAISEMKLHVPAGQTLSPGAVLQLLPNAALDSQGHFVAEQTIQILNESEFKQRYGGGQNEFRIDDLASFYAQPVDLNGDGVISRYDIVFLLTLVEPVTIP